jgi:phosphoglycolate phosphatase-like HAD superfamily hydrolase
MPIDPQRVKALCFDVDGTLRDTDDQYVSRLAKWLEPLHFLFPQRDGRLAARQLVMGLESPANFFYRILDWLAIDDEVLGIGEWLHKKQLLKPKHEFLIVPQADACLARLSLHFPMAVVSTRGERGTRAFLDHFDFTGLFDCVASGLTTPHTKPWPDPVLWAAEKMGVPAENCLMMGDTTVDIRAGRAAGAQTIGVLSGFGYEKELLEAGADQIIESVANLPQLLR